jgi:hypothetical protein
MGDEDDTPGAGSPLPENLFAAERWGQEREAPPTGAVPIGLGGASAAGAEPELAELGSLLRSLFDDAEQLSRIKREHGLQWVIDKLKAEDGHQAVSAAMKRPPGRPPLTAAQVWHRVGMAEALRRHGCPTDTEAGRIIAAAHAEDEKSVIKALGEARCRAAELGIADRIARIPDEDLRWLNDRLRAAAWPGGEKLPGFMAARRKSPRY